MVSLTRGNCGEHLKVPFRRPATNGQLIAMEDGEWGPQLRHLLDFEWEFQRFLSQLNRSESWILSVERIPNLSLTWCDIRPGSFVSLPTQHGDLKSLHAKVKTRPPSLSPSFESDAHQGQRNIVGIGFPGILREDSKTMSIVQLGEDRKDWNTYNKAGLVSLLQTMLSFHSQSDLYTDRLTHNGTGSIRDLVAVTWPAAGAF